MIKCMCSDFSDYGFKGSKKGLKYPKTQTIMCKIYWDTYENKKNRVLCELRRPPPPKFNVEWIYNCPGFLALKFEKLKIFYFFLKKFNFFKILKNSRFFASPSPNINVGHIPRSTTPNDQHWWWGKGFSIFHLPVPNIMHMIVWVLAQKLLSCKVCRASSNTLRRLKFDMCIVKEHENSILWGHPPDPILTPIWPMGVFPYFKSYYYVLEKGTVLGSL